MYDILSNIYILIVCVSSFGVNTEQLILVQDPVLAKQTKTELSFTWETNVSSDGYFRYSKYPQTIDQHGTMISSGEHKSSHETTLKGLESGAFYYFQSINIIQKDTIMSEARLFSPASNSSGEIEIYFNNAVKESVSLGAGPDGVTTEVMEKAIIAKIDAARAKIDYCIYNTHRQSIVDALMSAHSRGVQVRVIFNERLESSNVAIGGSMPFGTLERVGDGLMHNKFLIIDADDEDRSWVMTGSTNFTNEQMDIDPNHIVFVQDKNLAKAFEIEFEEMWGSEGAAPDLSNTKFGVAKSDNTPHEFMINGSRVELYFSPSDKVSRKINRAIGEAQSTIDAALLIFTKWETRDVLLDEINRGTKFRAIIEDQENSEDIISSLDAVGADIIEHSPMAQLHHKYAIIDESLQNENSKVILGSHNWTHSADTRHDENLLIIHNKEVANIFQQEFEARWAELRSAVVDIEKVDVLKLYPNPAFDFVSVKVEKSVSSFKILDIRGALRQEVEIKGFKEEQLLDISMLETGTYLVVGMAGNLRKSIGTFIKTRK